MPVPGTNYKVGDTVKYSKPAKGEEDFRFKVLDHVAEGNGRPATVRVEATNSKLTFAPVETCHPSEYTHAGNDCVP